jgi:hypothetical protein
MGGKVSIGIGWTIAIVTFMAVTLLDLHQVTLSLMQIADALTKLAG